MPQEAAERFCRLSSILAKINSMARPKTVTMVGWATSKDGSAPTDASIYVSRRRVNDLFLRGALESFAADGPAAFKRAATENPASYLKVFALLMPREINVKQENVAGALSDEQLALMVAELEERIARRLAGGDAKQIEAKALPAPEPIAGGWSAERKAKQAAAMKAYWARRKAGT